MELNDLRPLNQTYAQEVREQEELDHELQNAVGQQGNDNNDSSAGVPYAPSGHPGLPVYNGVNDSLSNSFTPHYDNANGFLAQNNTIPSTSQYTDPNDVVADPWISPWLRLSAMITYICVTLLIQGTLIALVVISTTNHGLANVPGAENDRPIFSFNVGVSLAWTFVPAALFQAYGFVYAAALNAACTRQPFVELLKNDDDGAAPEKSILLDYSSWIPPVNIYKALKFGHNMLAWAQIVPLLAQFLLGPIGSHLFDSTTILRNSTVTIVQDTAFDDNAFDIVRGMSSALDFASASLPRSYRRCNFGGHAGILFTEDLSTSYASYAQAYRASCDADAGTSRIIALAALKDDLSARTFSNVSVVSCMSSYQDNTGIATLTYTGANNMVLRSYDLTQQATLDNPLFAPNFESQVCQTSVTNIQNEQATKLGDYILGYAKKQDPQAYLSNDDVFVNATKTILQSAFNVMVQTILVQPSDARELQGNITRPQSRLIVVLPVAYTILGILLAVDLALLWAWHYTYRYKEAQFEESTGLMGAAILLYGSDLNAEIGRRKATTGDGKIGEDVSYDLRHGQRLGWKIEHWPYPRRTKLVSTQKARPVRLFRP